MRKSLFVITALSMTAVVGSMPLTAQAAGVRQIQYQAGNGYAVIGGSDIYDLRQTLECLGITIGADGSFCPAMPGAGIPDMNVPDTTVPVLPDTGTENPGTNTPGMGTENPGTSIPGTGTENPGTSIPGMGTENPGTSIPGTGTENPGTSAPGTGTENPGAGIPGTGNSGAETPDPGIPGDENTGELNAYAAQVVKLVNEERAKKGLSELKVDLNVTAAANVRAKEITQSFSHTRPDGSSFYTALKEQGVSYRGCGENIAYGQKTAENVMDAWMNSEGHRANILDQNYKNIGVGFYEDAKGVKYWVQLFTY